MKIMFIGGPRSPALKIGKIYNLPKRHLNFPWFINAPANSNIGDVIAGTQAPFVPETKQPETPEYKSNLNVPSVMTETISVIFRGGKNAPAGFGLHKTYIVPKRIARFKWFRVT